MSALGPALRFVLSLLAAALCAPLFAQVPGKAYAQELVDRTVARHPGLLAVTLHATPSGGGEPVMIAPRSVASDIRPAAAESTWRCPCSTRQASSWEPSAFRG